jgi:hypothetical protein
VTDRPTRATVAGRAYLDLQNLARRTQRPTDELHQIYALEGFLARLVESANADRLILKGGVLLAALDVRRPTRDVDFQGRHVANDVEQVLAMVKVIASIPLDDGLALNADAATAEIIRDQDEYSGVRVTLTGHLAAAHLTFHVDINVGDPIWPAPQMVTLPRLLDGSIRLVGYPLAMVHAEKLVTAVQRGAANTRWRDFVDIYALSRPHDIGGDELTSATRQVAEHRGARLTSLGEALGSYATQSQRRWAVWLRKQHLTEQVPNEFGLISRRSAGSLIRSSWARRQARSGTQRASCGCRHPSPPIECFPPVKTQSLHPRKSLADHTGRRQDLQRGPARERGPSRRDRCQIAAEGAVSRMVRATPVSGGLRRRQHHVTGPGLEPAVAAQPEADQVVALLIVVGRAGIVVAEGKVGDEVGTRLVVGQAP